MKRLFTILFIFTICNVAIAQYEPIRISNPNSTNVIFSDPTKTLLLGASSIPADYSSTLDQSSQELILTDQVHYPFSILGAYRNGSSGPRYFTGFFPDGHFFTNQYLTISGVGDEHSESGGYMQSISTDVPTALTITNNTTNDAGGGRLISGWGNRDNSGAWTDRIFSVGSQGTVSIQNPYGQTGSIQYDRPQIALGDIGSNNAAPAWTYGAIHQKSGHTYIGSYTGTGGSANESKQIDISSTTVTLNSLNTNITPNITSGGQQDILGYRNNRSGGGFFAVLNAESVSGQGLGNMNNGGKVFVYAQAGGVGVFGNDAGPSVFVGNNRQTIWAENGVVISGSQNQSATPTDPGIGHIGGGGAAPTIANGAGAGTSPGTPTITGTDFAGSITIITGTSPTASAVVATITFASAYGTAPYVVMWPANAATSTLSFLPYVTSTTTTFVVNTGTTAFGASTTYKYNYHVIQ